MFGSLTLPHGAEWKIPQNVASTAFWGIHSLWVIAFLLVISVGYQFSSRRQASEALDPTTAFAICLMLLSFDHMCCVLSLRLHHINSDPPYLKFAFPCARPIVLSPSDICCICSKRPQSENNSKSDYWLELAQTKGCFVECLTLRLCSSQFPVNIQELRGCFREVWNFVMTNPVLSLFVYVYIVQLFIFAPSSFSRFFSFTCIYSLNVLVVYNVVLGFLSGNFVSHIVGVCVQYYNALSRIFILFKRNNFFVPLILRFCVRNVLFSILLGYLVTLVLIRPDTSQKFLVHTLIYFVSFILGYLVSSIILNVEPFILFIINLRPFVHNFFQCLCVCVNWVIDIITTYAGVTYQCQSRGDRSKMRSKGKTKAKRDLDRDTNPNVRKYKVKYDVKQRERENVVLASVPREMSLDTMNNLTRIRAPLMNQSSEFVFPEPIYKRIKLQEWMTTLQYKQIPSILGSLWTYRPTSFPNQQIAQSYQEFRRRTQVVRESWLNAEDGGEALRDYLVYVYTEMQLVELKPQTEYKTHPHHKYENDARVKCSTIDQKHFLDSVSKNGKYIEPLLTKSNQTNILFDLIGKCYAHRNMLTMQKIRSILKQQVSEGKTCDQVIELFDKKCYLWKQKTPDYAKFSWVVPHVPPEVLYYQTNDNARLVEIFKNSILGLRDSIFRFIREYYEFANLSRVERDVIRTARIENFKTIMRTPEIQTMFISGMDKSQVTDYVYRNYNSKIAKVLTKNEIFQEKRTRKIVSREKTRSKKRDEKFSFLNEGYSPQSFANRALNIFEFVTTLGFLIYFVYRQFSDQINNFINRYRRLDANVERLNNNVAYWDRILAGTENVILTDSQKLLGVDIKTALHTIYYVYKGDRDSAFAWSSNFLLTRPEVIRELLGLINFDAFGRLLNNARAIFVHQGVQYEAEPDQFNEILEAFDNGLNVEQAINNHAIQHIQPQSNELIELFTGLGSFFTKRNLINLSESDLRLANMQFQYIKNTNYATSENAKMLFTIISVVSRTLFAFDPFDIKYQEFASDMLRMIQFVDEKILLRDDLITHKAEMVDILAKHKIALEMNVNPRMQTIPSFFRSFYMKRFVELEDLARKSTALLRGTHNRVEPTFVLFTGPPKVGKSATMKFMYKNICHLRGTVFSHEMVYPYNGKDDYWENYARQTFVQMDDIFKQTDQTVLGNEAAAIIDMVNTSVYPLNMAFADKGSVFFDSEFILASTNIANAGIKNAALSVGLVDPQALKRRFHICLHREKVTEKDAKDNVFRVDQCIMFPHLVGKHLTSTQCTLLVLRCKEKQLAEFNDYDYTPERLEVINQEHRNKIYDHDLDFLNRAYDPNPQLELNEPDIYETESEGDIEPHSGKVMFDQFKSGCQRFGLGVMGATEFLKAMINAASQEYHEYFVQPIMIATFYLLISFTVIGGLYQFARHYFGGSTTQSREQNMDNGRKKKKPKQVARRMHLKRVARFYAESNDDNYYRSLINKLSAGTMYTLAKAYDTEGNVVYDDNSISFHVKDGYCLMTAHAFLPFIEYDEVTFEMTWNGGSMTIPMPTDALHNEEEDLVMFKLPNNINKPPSLYKHFWDTNDHHNIQIGTLLKLLTINQYGSPMLKDLHKSPQGAPAQYSNSSGDTFIVDIPVNYYGSTMPGDSGGLITLEGPQGQAFIIGMHVGAKRGFMCNSGIAVPLSKEVVDKLITEFYEPQSCPHTGVPELPHVIKRTVPSTEAHYPPRDSKIKRSALYGWNGSPVRIPASLRPIKVGDEIVDPLTKAMLKQRQVKTPETHIPEDTMDYLFHLYPRNGGSVVSWEEALRGDPVKGSLSINAGTSPGYPYSLGHTKGKAPYVQIQDDLTFQYEPDFFEKLVEMERELIAGRQVEVLWADVLKDENRPVEKVLAGNTRLFSTCPLHYLFLVRRYFMDFVTYVQAKAATHPVSVGLNVHSIEWTIIFNRMQAKNASIVAGDFKNFDGKVPSFIGRYVLSFINSWYDDGAINARIRELLFEHIYNANHICFDKVYELSEGNPSGNPITSIYNSFCNLVMTYIVFTQDCSLRADQFDCVFYGDDSICAIEVEGITIALIAPYYKERFDMDLTHCTKVEGVVVKDTIFTIKYVGRRFVKMGSVIRAPLDLTTICESTYWIRGSNKPEEVLLSNAQTLFLELSHYPRDVFEDYSRRFLQKCEERVPTLYPYILAKKLMYHTYYEVMYVAGKTCKIMFAQSNAHTLTNLAIGCEDEDFTPQSADSKMRYSLNFPERDRVYDSDNIEFTARAVNEPDTTEEVQLGSYLDVAPISSTQVNSTVVQELHNSFTTEGFDLNEVLSREFNIATVDWSTTQAQGTLLKTLKFPKDLFDQPFVQAKLNDFKYFVGGVRVSCRMTANRTLYGKLIMDHRPYMLTTGGTEDIVRMSGSPHVLISASASEVVTFDIPFIYPQRALNILTASECAIAQCNIVVLNPLTEMSGETSSAQVFITARFLEPKVYLPHDTAALALKAGFDGEYVVQSSNGNKEREAVDKSQHGVISSTLENLDAVSESIESFGLGNPATRLFRRIAKPAAGVAKMFGLSKPTTLDSTVVMTPNMNFNMNYGKGISTVPKIAMDPANAISTKPVVGGISTDELDLRYIVGIPCIYKVATMNKDSIPVEVFMFDNNSLTYVDWITNLFSYFSGSYKLKVYITASIFHNVRGVFYFTDDVDADWQNCYHKVIEIQGDTETAFMIPYPDPYFMGLTGTTSPWKIYFKVLSWSQVTPSAVTPIHLNVYKAGADDFKFGCLRNCEYTPQSNPRQDFASEFEFLHPKMTKYMPNNVVMGEEYTTLREIIHRFLPYYVPASTEKLYALPINGTPSCGLEMIGFLFRFWRGSIRVKYLQKNNNPSCAVVKYGNYQIAGAAVSNAVTPNVELDVPFYNPMAFEQTHQSFTYTGEVTVGKNTEKFLFKAGGDDFSFHFLKMPPPGAFTTPSSLRGSQGVISFYS